tara:strand:- start:195 stop:524 length:330 start_codon:yes stop_codon:yes gene_type:complete
MKTEIKKLYYSIGEVSKIVKLKPYVLRYWETEFKQLSPPKNRAGNRTYRQKDIDIILEIKNLLYNKKFTIEGARTFIGSKNISNNSSNQKDYLMKIKLELQKIKRIINE